MAGSESQLSVHVYNFFASELKFDDAGNRGRTISLRPATDTDGAWSTGC